MKAGYVISGVVFISLATVFAFLAGVVGIIVYFGNLAASTAGGTLSPLVADYQNALIILLVVATLFYIVGGIFLWQGFKPQPYYPPRYVPPYSTPYPQQHLQQYTTGTTLSATSGSSQTGPTPSTVTVMANCSRCNTRIPAEAKFCPSCGADLRPKAPTDPVLKP